MNQNLIETQQVAGKFVPKASGGLRRLIAKSVGTAGAVGGALVSGAAMALTESQNTAITAAYDATGVSVNLVIAGLIGVVLLITGFGIIYGLLKR